MRQRILASLGPLMGGLLLVAALVLLRRELGAYQLGDLERHIAALPTGTFAAALGLTLAGYLTLTGYDTLAFRYARHPLPYRRIALASFIAYVFSHNVGLSFFGGSAVRYRVLTGFGVPTEVIARVVVFVLATFWLGFLLIAGAIYSISAPSLNLPWIPFASSRLLGIALLTLLGGYLFAVIVRRGPIRMRGFEVELPTLWMTLGQLAISALDWALAASVLYVVLPASVDLPFPVFLGSYLAALVVGLASHVPAGLGVFEAALVVLLRPYLPGDQVLASVLVYRTVYYLLPMVIAVALFCVQEIRRGRRQLERFGEAAQGWLAPVAPWLFAATTFLAGALLLLSGATPELPERLEWLQTILPLPVIEMSKLAGSIVGVLLLVLANALRERVDAAYYATLLLLASGVAASLAKGLDWEEASVLTAMGAALWPCRPCFYRRSSLLALRLSPNWWVAVFVVALFSMLAFELAYRHVAYSSDLWWKFGPGVPESRSFRALIAGCTTLLGIGFARLLRPAQPVPTLPTPAELDRAQSIVARQTRSDGYLALLGDKEILFHEGGEAFLMFGVSGRTFVAMGDPIGSRAEREALAWRFRELADQHGAEAVFYEVSNEALPIYLDLGLELRKLGEVGRVPLSSFTLEGHDRSDLRQAQNRMQREDCRFDLLEADQVAPLLDELQAVSDDWLAAKHTREKRFSLGYFDRSYLRRLPIALVRRGEAVVAFANVWPGGQKHELSIDLMRYRRDAPKGVMEFLFTELMLWGRDHGYQWFSLGMAPLSGFEQHRLAPMWSRLGSLLFRHGGHFYNFQGLRDFKNKFHPEWEPRYLAAPSGLVTTPLVLTRIASLVSGGVAGVIRE